MFMPKLNQTSIKMFIIALAIFEILLPFKAKADLITSCEIRELDANAFEINIIGQFITVIGWTHGLLPHYDKTINAIYEADHFAANNDCSSANQILQANLNALLRFDQSAQRVRRLLVENRHNISEIGTERTEEGADFLRNENDAVEKAKVRILQHCPHLSDRVDRNLDIYPGVEIRFAYKNELPFFGVEDQEIRKKSEVLVEEYNEIDFTLLNTEARRRFVELMNIKNGFESMSRDELDALVNLEPLQENRSLLRTARNNIVLVRHYVGERNTAIIDNILNRETNHGLIIGAGHISDLKQQLKNKCSND
jgi:hypothetical protein